MQSEFRQLAIAKLIFSTTTHQVERRARFDPAAMTELSESIKVLGVAQPILVRPAGKDDKFEVIAGERRVLAAKKAGLEDVPAMVRVVDDEQLLELQLVENLQREDVHPMTEAEGYEALREMGRSADEIADKVGKSKAYVYARIKLLDLCKEGRRAFYDGKLNASTGLYLARIPVEKLQQQALKEITTGGDGGEPMSAREAQEHIHDNYMLRLSDAGFKTEDANLVPKAGACGACPKRTGNQAQLFGDVKGADVCTDPVCFRSKLAAHATQAIAAAKANGQKVLRDKDAKKAMPYEHLETHLQGFVFLDARNYSVAGNKTNRETLGKDYKPTILVNPYNGKLHEVAPISDMPRERQAQRPSSGSASNTKEAKAKREKDELKNAIDDRTLKDTLAAIFKALPKTPGREELLSICEALESETADFEGLLVAVGIHTDAKKVPSDPRKALAGCNADQLGRLAYIMSLDGGCVMLDVQSPNIATITAKRLGIDVAKVRAAATKALAPVAAAAPAAKKKAKAPAKKKAKR